MKKVTISDVARRAGVSKATVSAVINEKGTVNKSTRRHVLQVIEDLNYRPSASARRRFRSSATRSIGVVIKEMKNPYYADVILGVRDAVHQKGYTVFVTCTEGEVAAEHTIVEVATAKEIDGLIITPILDDRADLSHIFELKRRNIPFVLLESVRGLQASLVDVNNIEGSKKAVKHLIDLGHSRIVHFAGPPYSLHSDERVEGVRRAFSESRLIFDEDLIIPTGADVQDGYEQGLRCFGESGRDRPTAVTCYNDLVAIGLLRALQELGLRTPDDVSVIGYDNIDFLDNLSIPLTSVNVPRYEMGLRAAELLIRQLETSNGLRAEKVELPTELVLRESTAPPSGP